MAKAVLYCMTYCYDHCRITVRAVQTVGHVDFSSRQEAIGRGGVSLSIIFAVTTPTSFVATPISGPVRVLYLPARRLKSIKNVTVPLRHGEVVGQSACLSSGVGATN